MTETASDLQVHDNPARHRYEVLADGTVAGHVSYQREGGLITFVHTEVEESFEGQGVASRLVRDTLEMARHHGLRVRPVCEFYGSYIDKHPEYADLVED